MDGVAVADVPVTAAGGEGDFRRIRLDETCAVARNVIIARRERNWSQYTLAERAGVSRMSVYRLERGETRTRYSTLRLLASVLDVDVSDLLRAPVRGEAEAEETWRLVVGQVEDLLLNADLYAYATAALRCLKTELEGGVYATVSRRSGSDSDADGWKEAT
jgi:transcriptional regulator with XRE-family HTH domain